MILSSEQMEPSAKLLAENAEMATRFTERGTDLAKIQGMTFMCDFPDGKSAHGCLAAFRAQDVAKITEAKPWLCESDTLPVMMNIEIEMGFDVAAVSKIEWVLIAVSRSFGGGDVSWEYLRPGTGPQEKVN